MTNEEYKMAIEETIQDCIDLLTKKKNEYSPDEQFHNFEVAAKLQHTTPEKALGGMLCKHTVSVFDMIENGISNYSMEKWNEKICDHINYLLILQAMVYNYYSLPKAGY